MPMFISTKTDVTAENEASSHLQHPRDQPVFVRSAIQTSNRAHHFSLASPGHVGRKHRHQTRLLSTIADCMESEEASMDPQELLHQKFSMTAELRHRVDDYRKTKCIPISVAKTN